MLAVIVPITSPDDERVTDYVGLRDRDRPDVVIAESAPVVERLLASPFVVRSCLLTPKGHERMREAIVASGVQVPVFVADPDVVRRIVGYDLHRGVLASAERPSALMLDDVLADATRVVVLEGSNDHENIGVVARSARALGFDALVLSPNCADPYYRRSVRVSMGEILHLPVVRCTTWPDPLTAMARAGFQVWALTPDPRAASLSSMPVPGKVAVLAGAEGPGLTADARALASHEVRIPMHHGVDSLNLGHALAITMAAVSPPLPG